GRGKVAFAPQGDLLAYYDGAKPQKVIVLWNARQRAETHRLPLNAPLRDFAFTRDGRLFTFVTSTSDYSTAMAEPSSNNITIWDVKARQMIRTLRGQRGELWTLDVSPDGRWLASGCKDGSVSFWDLSSSTNRPLAYRELHTTNSLNWSYSPDGRLIGVLRKDG